MTRQFLLVLLLPVLIDSQGWKINQPHRYIILNGEYIPLPVEERETESPSLMSSLNPINAFQKIWNSLPTLTLLKGQDQTSGSDDSTAQESAPSSITLPFSNFFTAPASSSPDISSLFTAAAFGGGFLKKSSHSIKRRSVNFPPHRAQPRQSQKSNYYYKNLGQGSFMRYTVPPPQKEAIPPSFNPYGGKFNSKYKPYYTKPYYHPELTTSTTPATTTTKTGDKDDDFPCPKVGLWTYDGTRCIAGYAIPPWSCKPIDLLQSGKLVLCRDKVFY